MNCAYLEYAMQLQPSFHPRREISHQCQFHQNRRSLHAEGESRHDYHYTRCRHLRHDSHMVAVQERSNLVVATQY